jgi:ubiquinone/menaquinone biosynthesis C-methylase UbiE
MSLNNLHPTERFSDRVKDYVKFRPTYPSDLLDYLDNQCGLQSKTVADIGSGTGIFTKLLLDRGAIVEGVEPNQKMREAAEKEFGNESLFHSRNGTAEATTLPNSSVDLITCAQAFHWFEPEKTRKEFDRILKPQGKIALIWNDVDQNHPVGAAYEKFKIAFSDPSLKKVRAIEAELDITIPKFFNNHEEKIFSNFQDLNEEGLLGRYFSSSYAPPERAPNKPKAAAKLRQLFAQHQKDGLLRLPYKTELFLGT